MSNICGVLYPSDIQNSSIFHTGFLNCLFLDVTLRKVGLKEL